MARDLKIQNTTLDPNLYTYRQARDVSKTQVDWATLTKTLSDDLSKIRDEREKTRQDTIDSQRELLKEIENTDKLSHETANTLIQGAAYDASQVLNTDFQLLTSGQIKLKDYKKTEQRVRDNFTSLKNVMDGFEAHFVESQKRVDEGLANPDEIAANMSLSGFGSMQNIDIVWQPNGTMTLVRKRYDAEGNELPVDPSNPANVIPIGSMKGYLNHQSTYVDPNESAKGIVDTLGSFITSRFLDQQKVTSLEDFRNLSYEGKTNKDLINSMITELITTDQQKISMLRAKGYTEDDFTFDPKEAEEEGKILMINNAGGSGRMGYKFTEQAEADMRDLGRQIIERQLDSKITNVKGVSDTYTQTEYVQDITEGTSQDIFGLIDGVTTGSAEMSEADARSLVSYLNANPGTGDKAKRITSIEKKVNPDGTIDIVISREGISDEILSSKGKSVLEFDKEFYNSVNPTQVLGDEAAKNYGTVGSEFGVNTMAYTAPAQQFEINAPNVYTALGTGPTGDLMLVDYVANALGTSSTTSYTMAQPGKINVSGLKGAIDLILDTQPGLKNEIDKQGGVNVEFRKEDGATRLYIDIPGSNSMYFNYAQLVNANTLSDTINKMLERSANKISEEKNGVPEGTSILEQTGAEQ